jgi:hypothetical protein
MRALALLLLASCAHAGGAVVGDANHVCEPPPSIAGYEPSLCWWPNDGDGEAWCTYDIAKCEGTYLREHCEGTWVKAWAECELPWRTMPRERGV